MRVISLEEHFLHPKLRELYPAPYIKILDMIILSGNYWTPAAPTTNFIAGHPNRSSSTNDASR